MDRTIFYQDNESAIKMEKNGLKSCGSKSRHIKIRYFFIKDILDNEGIELKHCKTEVMLADFLTKPLQGSQFRMMRDIIMGITPFPVEERVGDYRKVTKNVDVADTTGARTDGNKSLNRSLKPTYAEILMKGKDDGRRIA